jgi:putative alpha-1,2-mannosidase
MDIQNGGKLEFNLGKNPNPSWGHQQTDMPYSLSLETHN